MMKVLVVSGYAVAAIVYLQIGWLTATRYEKWNENDFKRDDVLFWGAFGLWPAVLLFHAFIRWPLKAARRGLVITVTAPEAAIRRWKNRSAERAKRRQADAAQQPVPAAEPPVVSPATRLDEIRGQIAKLEVEKQELERRPDAARL